MPTVSSLIRSAQATQKKIRSQEDALAAFDWENSAQTYEDYAAYSKYLEDRSKSATDVGEKITYETKIRSARRSYTSNELQRQQMAIMEGRATTSDKMSTIADLYAQAVDNGDYNLAQNLYSQWDALSIKLQNERETASRAYAAAGDKAFKELEKKLTKGVDDVTLPTGERVTPLSAIKRNLEQTGDTFASWQAAQDTLMALRNLVIDQYQTATTQDRIDALEEKYGAGLEDIDKKLVFSVGGKNLNLQQVMNAAANDSFNNPIYSLKAVRNEATGKNEFKLQENNVERLDYVRQFDEQGNEYYEPASIRTDQNSLFFGGTGQGRGLATQITDSGQIIGDVGQGRGNVFGTKDVIQRNEALSIGNRLKALGIIARQNGTTLSIKLPGESVEREATIQPDGSIRYFGDDGQLLEIGLTKRNLGTESMPAIFEAGQSRVVSPDELSDFGSESTFGGRLSRASNLGRGYIGSITGQTKADNFISGKTPLGVLPSTSFGTALTSRNIFGTSALIQGAQATQRQIQEENQRKQMEQMLLTIQGSQANLSGINTTPVRQFASNGVAVKQLAIGSAYRPQLRIGDSGSTAKRQLIAGSAGSNQRIVPGASPSSGVKLTLW